MLRPKHGQPLARLDCDSSIELDQQWVDGFLIVSLESLQVILRDERQIAAAS